MEGWLGWEDARTGVVENQPNDRINGVIIILGIQMERGVEIKVELILCVLPLVLIERLSSFALPPIV